MDEVARVVSTAFTVSNDLRRDVEVVLLFGGTEGKVEGGRRIVVHGARVRYLNPDERSTAALLKNALTRAIAHPRDFESSPGLVVGPVDGRAELARLAGEPHGVWLTETGGSWESLCPPGPDRTFFLSDPYDPTDEEVAVLRAANLPAVSVGPRSLRASQVVDVVHHLLDVAAEGGPNPPG